MLTSLFRRKPAPDARAARVPDGVRIYAIGDIHGRLDLLNDLLDQIDADSAGRKAKDVHLIFLGDLMDRGSDSAGVIERVRQLSKANSRVQMLMGNHEEVYLGAAGGSEKMTRLFCKIGGKETILSYGISYSDYRAMDMGALAERLTTLIPHEHVNFVRTFEDYIVLGDYLFVHAGIRPGVTLEAQRKHDMYWIRGEFTNDETDHGKIVVHGHTITDGVEEMSNRIGIDTGAFASGILTALALEGDQRWFLQTKPG